MSIRTLLPSIGISAISVLVADGARAAVLLATDARKEKTPDSCASPRVHLGVVFGPFQAEKPPSRFTTSFQPARLKNSHAAADRPPDAQ